MSERGQSTDDMDRSESDESLVVVMDSFGGDWTPFAVFYDSDEALRLQEMLGEDAEAKSERADYYASQEDVLEETVTSPPAGLDEVTVAFKQSEVLGVSAVDYAAREVSCQQGGWRKTVDVYETAEDVAEAKPSAIGQFIASQMTAEEIVEVIR